MGELEHQETHIDWSALSAVVRGWSELRARTWVWAVVVGFALLNALVFAPFFVFGPTLAAESLGGSNAWSGILLAMGVGQMAGFLVALSWTPKRPLLVAMSVILLWTIPTLLLASLAPVILIAVGMSLAGASMALFMALWETTLQIHIPSEFRSRLSAYDLLGSYGLMPVGLPLAGYVQNSVGASVGLRVGACLVVVVIGSLIAVPSVRRIRAVVAAESQNDAPTPAARSRGDLHDVLAKHAGVARAA